MTTKEIKEKIEENFGAESIIESEFNVQQPFLIIHPLFLVDICYFLKNEEPFYFDYLSALTGVDYGPSENKMAVIYHLYSLSQGHFLVLKCLLTRSKEASRQSQVQPNQQSEESFPEAPSVSEIWLAADWHERETYDLLGIRFVGRENLRRILLPEDWEGFPLRKDYTTQSTYHEIQVDYY